MKTILATLVLLASVNSFAIIAHNDGPQIEPGPPVQLEESANEAVDALLMASSTNISQFRKAGNRTQSVERRAMEPGKTTYTFTRQHCMTGGITGGMCMGGAILVVNIEEVQQGSMVKVKADSKVLFIK